MKTLITGAAGFIGYHVAERLLSQGHAVLGVDNLNPYYDPRLKRARLARLARHARFEFKHLDLAERQAAEALFERPPIRRQWFIWRRKPACATRSKTRTLTSNRISPDSCTCSKARGGHAHPAPDLCILEFGLRLARTAATVPSRSTPPPREPMS